MELKLSNAKDGNIVNLSSDLVNDGQERQDRCLIEKVFLPKAINHETSMP